jgi:hypothetical protein
MNDKRILKTYVWHDDECFFVSTSERDSSASVSPPPRFFETFAWKYDWTNQVRGEQVASAGSGPAWKQHAEVCEQLFRHGVYESE